MGLIWECKIKEPESMNGVLWNQILRWNCVGRSIVAIEEATRVPTGSGPWVVDPLSTGPSFNQSGHGLRMCRLLAGRICFGAAEQCALIEQSEGAIIRTCWALTSPRPRITCSNLWWIVRRHWNCTCSCGLKALLAILSPVWRRDLKGLKFCVFLYNYCNQRVELRKLKTTLMHLFMMWLYFRL